MSDPGTDREQLAGALADARRGCECGPCLQEAERFIVEHVDPMTKHDLANAWEKGWRAGTGDRLRSGLHPGTSTDTQPAPG